MPRGAPARPGLRDQQEESAHEGPPGLSRRRHRRCAGLLATLLAAVPARGAPIQPAPPAGTEAQPAPPGLDALNALLLRAPDADHAAALAGQLEALRMRALSPTVRLLLRRSQRELGPGHTREALADIDDAIGLQPGPGLLWRERAAVRAMAGDADGAVADLGAALGRDPTDTLSWAALSLLEERRGHARAAYEAWKQVLLLDPETPNGAATLARLHHRMQGDPT